MRHEIWTTLARTSGAALNGQIVGEVRYLSSLESRFTRSKNFVVSGMGGSCPCIKLRLWCGFRTEFGRLRDGIIDDVEGRCWCGGLAKSSAPPKLDRTWKAFLHGELIV